MSIVCFSTEQAGREIGQLSGLLVDAVDSGASVGFMPPLSHAEAVDYWRGVIQSIGDGTRVLLVAMNGDVVDGAVQLALETRANGNHRAEAMKLFVHRRARRRGLAKALMTEVERTARRLGRTLVAVKARRKKLGLPQIDPPFVWWKPEEDKLLGTAPDRDIARQLGRSEDSVKGRRLLLGIKFPNPRRPWPEHELALLGTLPDSVLAK